MDKKNKLCLTTEVWGRAMVEIENWDRVPTDCFAGSTIREERKPAEPAVQNDSSQANELL